MSELGEFLEDQVWPNLDAASSGLLNDLRPKASNTGYILDCPSCEKRRAYYYKGKSIKCNRIENCGYVSTVWTYLLEYKQLSRKDTLFTVCSAVGVTPPNSDQPAPVQSVDLKIRRILEGAFLENVAIIQQRWKYQPKEMELLQRYCGYYPNPRYVLSKLPKDDHKKAEERGWIKPSLSGRLFGFWRQPSGATGFWARSVSSDEKPKYLFQAGMLKSAPYLAEECSPGKPLVAVEGGRDVLALKMMGFKNAIGTGGSHLTAAQARYLAHKFDHIVYIVDGDFAGMKGIVRTIDNASEFGITTEFVILPSNSDWDADDYRRGNDLNGMKKLWEARVDAGTALALAYIESEHHSSKTELRGQILSVRANLPKAGQVAFAQTLHNFGMPVNVETQAVQDLAALLNHFDMDEARSIVSRRYNLDIEFLRAVKHG